MTRIALRAASGAGSAAFAALFIVVTACSTENAAGSGGGTSGNGTSGTKSCTVAGRTGSSTCSADSFVGEQKEAVTCSAGTYCASSSHEARCNPGCQSDENCGPSERCVRCPTDKYAGTCRSCDLTDEAACRETDAPPTTLACTRNTNHDRDCLAPGKAYECLDPRAEPPVDAGTCTQTKSSTIFCCGGGVAPQCDRDTALDQPACMGKKAYRCEPGEEMPGCQVGFDGMTFCCP